MALGGRFIFVVVIILSVTLAINAIYSISTHKDKARQQLLEQGQTLGRYVALTSAEAILALDFVSLNNYMEDLTSERDIVAGIVLDPADQPITSIPPRNFPGLKKSPREQNLSVADALDLLRDPPSNIQLLEFPIVHGEQQLGRLVIAISLLRLAAETREALLSQLLIYGLIILVVSSSIYLAFKTNVMVPINELIKGASRIANGEFSKPVPVLQDDEMGELARSFNGMMQEVSYDRELLHYQANYDALTGLPNRLLGMELLHAELNRSRHSGTSFALLFIDLDNFKIINDTLGHAKGDELLKVVGSRLQSTLRESDSISRLGGDEFLVLLTETDNPLDTEQVAERIQKTVSEAMVLGEREIFVQCSIGIVMYPTDGDSAEALMANADNAMYQAKSPNSPPIRFFTAEMNESVEEHLSLYHDLHVAIEREQVFLEYQPVVKSDTGEIVGVESLMRWRHPIRGLIPPDVFIPIAEASGRIVSLGNWALHNACATFFDWKTRGLKLSYIAVNVSRIQFQKDILDTVQHVLAEYNMEGSELQLEITESALMERQEDILGIMNKLQAMQVRLALDDFGTGFSALSYLKHFPLQVLKIDKSFIAGLPDDPENSALVNGISAMARSLGLGVISEGVEHEGQRKFLDAGANYYQQGYLFGRPMSRESLSELLRSNKVFLES